MHPWRIQDESIPRLLGGVNRIPLGAFPRESCKHAGIRVVSEYRTQHRGRQEEEERTKRRDGPHRVRAHSRGAAPLEAHLHPPEQAGGGNEDWPLAVGPWRAWRENVDCRLRWRPRVCVGRRAAGGELALRGDGVAVAVLRFQGPRLECQRRKGKKKIRGGRNARPWPSSFGRVVAPRAAHEVHVLLPQLRINRLPAILPRWCSRGCCSSSVICYAVTSPVQ